MRLLVTGSAGFIGSNFVHYMLNSLQMDQKSEDQLKSFLSAKGIEIAQVD